MDRQRLAAALAYEEERRRRMMESVPVIDDSAPTTQPRRSLRSDLENLSSGLGQGIVNQLEGVKGLITDPVGTVKGTYETVKGVVRDPSLIADALRYTADKAMSGPLGAGEVIGEMLGPRKGGPMMQELDVYHGTPHRFPATEANPLGEFDASKIGTGEGAQAYGHGVYLAESPDIAKHYQTQLGKFYDQMQTPEGAMSLEEAVTKYHPDGKIAAKVLSTFRTKTDVDTFNKVINDEILPEIRAKYPQSEWGKFAPQQGTLYKADLPDEMIDRMLDWDKPLSKDAPQAVKDAFNKLAQTYPDLKEKLFAAYREGKPGSHYYSLLNDYAKTGDLVKNQTFASDAMRQAGIPGIKYLDAGSRGQSGSGTRNFVVFPGEEKKVKILERNGEKLAAALGTIKPKATVIEARATRAGRNLPDLEAELAAKNLTIQPNEKGGFDVYGRKVGFDPAIPQKLTTVKEGGRAAAIQAAKNIGRKADADLQAAKTRNPFTAYAEFGNLNDYIADRPDLLEKLTRKKLANVEPEIESVQPSFKNKNYRVRFKTGEEFSVENIKPETLNELKATVRKDLYNEQIPDQLQGKTVKDLISTLAWEERSEKYIKDVLSGKKRLRLED